MTSPDPREKESEQYIEQGKDNVLLNIDPTSPPPMKTLVYSPEIKILIARGNKQYDVSADVVAWSLRRPENSVASLVFRLSNKPASNTDLKKLRYNQLFERMDRVTVFLKRIEWVQVFSGYLDSVPHVQIYPGTVNFRASCTLKRLLHTWWDPGLPESQRIFDQAGRSQTELENGEMQTDMGLGSLLRRLLVLVGGWNPQNIHIQRFPSGFYDYMEEQIKRLTPGAEKDVRSFKELLLGEGDISMGPGRAAGRQQGVTMGGYMVSQPERMLEVIRAVDEMGMGPDTMDLAASQGLGTVAEGVKDYQDQEFSKGQTEVGKNWYDAALKSDAAIHCFMTIAAESNWIMYANRAAPESLGYPYDPGAISTDGSSVGLYQQQNNGAWGCLPAWSPVFTAHGPVPIIDVQEGDEVWSFNGDRMELAKVTGWQMTGYKRLLTIRTEGRALEVTANHRIPVRRYFGLSDGRRQGECGWETIEMCAGEIRPGDYVIVPHGLPSGDATTAPDGTLLTTELMELIGLYLGDGNRDGTGRIEISHGHGINEDHMPHYREIIESLGAEPRVDKRGTRTRFSLPWFRQFIDSWFPGKAGSKKLPDWVFRLSPDLQLGLLRGYLDSDGSVDKLGRVIWSTVSPELAEGVRHLCIQLGIPVGAIGVNRPRTGTIRGRVHRGSISYTVRASSTRHNLRIGSHSPHKAINFRINDIPAKSRYDQDWNSSICRRTPMGKPPTGTVYHRVRSVTQGESEVPVYDIEVGGLHHYVADGIVVHNSTAQRMNVRASTQMFLEQLKRYDWRNMDRAAACQAVQRSAFADGSNYKKWEQTAIEQVRAIRSGTGTATGAAGASSGNPVPGANLGGTPVGTNIAPALPGTSNASGVPGTPTVNGMPGPTAVAGALGKPYYDSGGALSCALAQVGKPYVLGANGPDAFDCIAEGTLVATDRGEVPIEEVTTNDRVMTRKGFRRVLRAWKVRDDAEVVNARINGRVLTGTPDHRVWTNNRGWVALAELERFDTVILCRTEKSKKYALSAERLSWEGPTEKIADQNAEERLPLGKTEVEISAVRPNGFFSMEWLTTDTQSRQNHHIALISNDQGNLFTSPSGNTTTVRFRKGMKYTTSTTTRSTMSLPTWRPSQFPNTVRKVRPTENFMITHAPCVELSFGPTEHRSASEDFVPASMDRSITTMLVRQRKSVYDLTVEGEHEFFANGVLVHNCSSLMQFSYRSIGLEISRTTHTQASQLERIPASNLRPGDMIQPDEGHVVMYVSPGWVVHAPQPGDVVRVARLWFDPNTAVCLRAPGAEFGGTVPTAFDITKAMSSSNAVAGTVTTGLNGTTGTGQTEPIARNLFTYQFAGGQFTSAISVMFGGEVGTQEKAFINDEPLIQTVVSFAQAGLRNFQSAPNGDFIAYYPDYFGLDGKDAVFALEDIEMKNVQIDLNDDAMATHVYISGSMQMNGSGGGGVMGWLNSKGVATVENQWLFARMAAAAPHVPGEFIPNGKDVMRKFGARPLQKSMSSVQSGPMEFLLAVQTFMTKWAEQYATTIETTFLPEVFPGMRLHLVDHGLQVYVAEVTHSGDYESGFTTSMVITAPSNPALRNMATNIFNSTAKDIAERRDLMSNKSEVAD